MKGKKREVTLVVIGGKEAEASGSLLSQMLLLLLQYNRHVGGK